MQPLDGLEVRMLAAPDQQISLTDPDCRSMATSGRGSGVVGYNVRDERARPLLPVAAPQRRRMARSAKVDTAVC